MPPYRIRRVEGDGDLAGAFAVRRAVFVEEQGVSEAEEMDGKESQAVHFVIHDRETGAAVGTARVRTPEGEVAKPERVAVRPEYRGEGLGERLMALVEAEARTLGCSRALLHAQTRVVPFYERFGYETTSEEFEEAGIPHVEMEKLL